MNTGTAELVAIETVILLGVVILLGTVSLAWVIFGPFDEREYSQVLAVQVQQIKSDEDALALAEQKITEVWSARIVNASYLSVENGTLNAQMFSDPNLAYKLRGSHVSPLEERGAAP